MIYETKPVNKKAFWIVVITIVILTPAYLFYVKKERAGSVKTLSVQPQVGDIYKMRQDTPEDGEFVFYLKIVKIDGENISFIRSKLTTSMPNDALLEQFDPQKQMNRTKDELREIAAGKWKVASRDKTEIIEIERR